MDQLNLTNSSGVMSNLIKLLPNGLNSQFPSLSDPQATPATPTTNVDNSFPFSIAPFIAVTATAIGTVSFVVCGARFLYNRMNSRRANGDDNNIGVAIVVERSPQQGVQGIEMSIQPPTNVLTHNALSGAVSLSADIIIPHTINQMPLPQSPASLETNDPRERVPSPAPQSSSPLPLSTSPLPQSVIVDLSANPNPGPSSANITAQLGISGAGNGRR